MGLLAGGCPDMTSECSRVQLFFYVVSHVHVEPTLSRTSPVSRREGGGSGCPVAAEKRRHQGETAEGEEGDATPDLLLKHSYATLATYA